MLLKTISTKTVYGDKERVLETVMSDKETEHFLYRVLGVVEAKQTGKGKHKRVDKETGEAVDTYWTKLFGEFAALNADQKSFEAATCFLPEYIAGNFVSRLDAGETDLEFAYDIFAVYSKGAATSYEFIAKAVRKEGEESKLTKMAAGFAALPGPKAARLEGPKKKG